MGSHWIRGTTDRPTKRRIVLIYETDDVVNAQLEQLLERIPYGRGNKTLLDCLRAGVAAMLEDINRRGGRVQSQVQQTSPAATGLLPSKAAPAELPTRSAASYSKTAERMFQLGDKGKE